MSETWSGRPEERLVFVWSFDDAVPEVGTTRLKDITRREGYQKSEE